MIQCDTFLRRRLTPGEGQGRMPVLYTARAFSYLMTGINPEPLRELRIQEAKYIDVQNYLAFGARRKGNLLIIEQFRLRIVEEDPYGRLVCVPDGRLAHLYVHYFAVLRFLRKTKWRIKATLQVWGILPMDKWS